MAPATYCHDSLCLEALEFTDPSSNRRQSFSQTADSSPIVASFSSGTTSWVNCSRLRRFSNNRVLKTRSRPPTTSESTKLHRVSRGFCGCHRCSTAMSGRQKMKMSIWRWLEIDVASSSRTRTSRSSWRRPAIFQSADSSARMMTWSKFGLIRQSRDDKSGRFCISKLPPLQ